MNQTNQPSRGQIELVKTTWNAVLPIADTAIAAFYDRLFVINPGLRGLFAHSDMAEQRRKLLKALNTVILAADRIETMLPVLRDLGQRHVAYGVHEAHYDQVGAALLATLESGLGEAWTTEVRDAWIAVYGVVSSTMIEGAASAAA